ncbi:putative bifunctional diguanylate cyclase/phosphodiesterase [Actinospongicola halichondriae]|uniref:putative bifunctional diguanylate cyclase/phosphodiesterase n=1 Tax=Actinospongicola halichondriae TaxID=3236844 RepID=UPI003D5CF9AB
MRRHGEDLLGAADVGRVFRIRSRVITGFALALPFLTDLGQDRFWVVAVIALVVLPYNLVLEQVTQRSGEVPAVVPWADQLVCIGATFFIAALWAPVLMVMTATIALAATLFDGRKVMGPAVASVAMAGVVGYMTQDPVVFIAGTVAFAGSIALTVWGISRITDARRSLETENRDLTENIDAIVWHLAVGATHQTISPAAERILDYPSANLRDVRFWMEHVHEDDRMRLQQTRQRSLQTGERQSCDYRITNGAGETLWFHEVISCEADAPPRPNALRGVIVDITARRAAENERAVLGEVVETLDTAIIVARPDPNHHGALVVAAANPAAARVTGTSSRRLIGTLLRDSFDHVEGNIAERCVAVAHGGPAFTVDRVTGVGIDRQRSHSVRAFPLPGGAVGLSLDDTTEATMVASALRRQALHDGLTGLPNRTLLRDRLQYALADARRRNERVALILLDLNHFKDVNDALGHQYGDRLLVAFSRRLQELLRECDTIARLGGDEFALLLTDATTVGAGRVVRKVSEAMQEPFEIEGVTVQTTASIGVALFPDHADDADLLTQRADVAMYNAKRGGGGWAVYSPQQDQSSVERLTLLSELHHQLDGDSPPDITLHYQPILDLADDRIGGAEALLRWNHPEFGWIDPELLVELAELSGLIQPLARFVAHEAMQSAVTWLADGHEVRVAINLSARNLYDRNLVQWLSATMEQVGLPPRLMKCELTESQVMDDPVLAMAVISELRDVGVHTAIDDFGTGYSSLSYLRRLPVDEIKIDKSFVTSMLADEIDTTIVRTVIDLAHNLGMAVLAEGVEDEATLGKLRDFGCDRIQGYVVGRPVPASEMHQMLRTPVERTG